MLKFFSLLLAGLSFTTMAKTPGSIAHKASRAVYVDFTHVNYEIRYDIRNENAYAISTIKFTQKEQGHPIYDLVPSAYSVKVNGKDVAEEEIASPDRVTSYKTISAELSPGEHVLEIKNTIRESVTFSDNGVQSAFWMSDLSDRNFLEQYLPTNMEFDHYPSTFDVQYINTKGATQKIYTNGELSQLKNNHFRIEFPGHFTASSIYFHTTTAGRFYEKKFSYKSIDGRSIPFTIYSRSSYNVSAATTSSQRVMAELEKNLGPWAHPQLVIYVAGSGGMEYCGATITSLSALGHEMTHSYYARGVMPINGSSGWVDEAIATWRGNGYPSTREPNFDSANMAGHGPYRRATDRQAYSKGANFMAYLNYELADVGGLTKFLAKFYQSKVFTSITTEDFRKELEAFSGMSFERDFNRYIYGKEGVMEDHKHSDIENPFHPKVTKAQLKEML